MREVNVIITLFIEPNIMKSQMHTQKIIQFCSSICTKITFATNLVNYNLSTEEYINAYSDFFDYYRCADENRRDRFVSDLDYRSKLLNTYLSEVEVSDYFDRLHQYDLIQFNELKYDLKQYVIEPKRNGNSEANSQDKSNHTKVTLSLPKEAYQGSKFTFESHCTIGGLYKIYDFRMTDYMIDCLMNLGYLFDCFEFDNIDTLEDPAFYSDNNLVLSVCTHERTASLFLSEEQYINFKLLDVPHNICLIKGS